MSTERWARTSTASPIAPGINQLEHPPVLRMEAVHEALHQRQTALLERLHDPRRLFVCQRQRLLTKDRFSGLSGADSPFEVHRIGKRNVNSVDFGVGQQRLVTNDANVLGTPDLRAWIARSRRENTSIPTIANSRDNRVTRDPRIRPKNSPAQPLAHDILPVPKYCPFDEPRVRSLAEIDWDRPRRSRRR